MLSCSSTRTNFSPLFKLKFTNLGYFRFFFIMFYLLMIPPLQKLQLNLRFVKKAYCHQASIGIITYSWACTLLKPQIHLAPPSKHKGDKFTLIQLSLRFVQLPNMPSAKRSKHQRDNSQLRLRFERHIYPAPSECRGNNLQLSLCFELLNLSFQEGTLCRKTVHFWFCSPFLVNSVNLVLHHYDTNRKCVLCRQWHTVRVTKPNKLLPRALVCFIA